jgi:alkanesulfonate monooxygenase SsuD/methylene tetrahydromethanopterin reductase-like flavin-dependent oxidoreductase (luciferase family)
MRLGLGVAAGPDPAVLSPIAAAAEEMGYESLWSNDTPLGEGLTQLDAWARASPSIELGVGVLPLDRHSAGTIATRANELGLPPDRLLLGLGAGFTNRPVGVVRDATAEIRQLMPDVRVLVAAMGPMMCRLAGEVGDGVLLNWMTPTRATWAREQVHQGASDARRDPAEVTIHGYVRVAIGARAGERLADEAAMYRQMPHYARHFEASGVDPAAIGIAVEDPAELPRRVGDYDALDVVVVRALSDRNPEAVLQIARAALA